MVAVEQMPVARALRGEASEDEGIHDPAAAMAARAFAGWNASARPLKGLGQRFVARCFLFEISLSGESESLRRNRPIAARFYLS